MHALVAGLGLLAALALAPGSALAADPCKAACKSTRKGCLAEAKAAFVEARNGCRGLEQPERKTCRRTAFTARNSARAACRADFRTCRTECGGSGGGGGGGGGGGRCQGSGYPDWFAAVNGFRGLAGLPAVTENPQWSGAALDHATYCVEEDYIGHSEDPTSPWFTEAGLLAAQNGNVAGTSDADPPPAWAIDLWMTGPFHAVGILDPKLAASGYGAFSKKDDSDVQSAAVLDVIRGRTGDGALAFPIVFPGDGTTFPLGRYTGNEAPDPLTSCPGYEAPTGPPLIALAGPADTLTALGATSLLRDGTPVEHCVFDGSTYVNPDAGSQSTARSGLLARSAVVVIPREPLQRGAVYDVSLVVNNAVIAWRFTHDCP